MVTDSAVEDEEDASAVVVVVEEADAAVVVVYCANCGGTVAFATTIVVPDPIWPKISGALVFRAALTPSFTKLTSPSTSGLVPGGRVGAFLSRMIFTPNL